MFDCRVGAIAECSPLSSADECVTHASAGIATFDRSIRNAMSSDGVRSPESHRLTTPGVTPIAVANSNCDHSSFFSRARRRSAAVSTSPMANVLTNVNALSTVNVNDGRCDAPVSVVSWQHERVGRPTFAENLQAFLVANRMSPAELARRLGVTGGAVSRWQSKGHLPNAQDFMAIAKVLGVDPWVLIGSSFTEPLPPSDVPPPGRRPKTALDRALEPTPRQITQPASTLERESPPSHRRRGKPRAP